MYSGIENVREKNQFFHVAQHVYPEESDGLYKAYLDATRVSVTRSIAGHGR